MANQSGQIYGLTILSPIKDDPHASIAHDMAIRTYLADLPRDQRSPLATITSTHLARVVVMDDVIFVGAPAREEHLKSRYLIFTSNFDGDLDTYLIRMATEIPEFVDGVWQHCVGYPGVQDPAAFVAYMTKCQLETTFYFADVNDKTVQQRLRALQVQAELTAFIEENQGRPPEEIQKAFEWFMDAIRSVPAPLPGSAEIELRRAALARGGS